MQKYVRPKHFYYPDKKRQTVDNSLTSAMGLDHLSEAMIPFELFNNATPQIISYNWVQLAEIYKNNGFIKLAVDLPVSDCFRNGGYDFDSNTLEAEELQELNDIVHNKDDEKIKQCMRWSRLYGGGSLVINSNQKPEVPLNTNALYQADFDFLACDRWQCFPLSSSLYNAEQFCLVDLETQNKDDIITFDKSRIKTFVGEVQPYFLRNQLQGWGLSILEQIIPQLNQYLKANSVILELLDEAKIDILKIFGLANTLASAGGSEAIRKRVEIFAKQKNFKNVGAMDAQDDYVQKTMSFSGLNEILEKIFLLICSSLRIPYSKVFGRGASGFSSGEDDLENYNAMIMSDLRKPAEDLIKWVGEIRCYQLFGRKVDDLIIKWKPLRVLSEREQQEVTTSKINSYVQLFQIGVLNRKQIAEQLNKDNIILFSNEELAELENDMDMSDIETEEQEQNLQANQGNKFNLANLFKR